MTRSHTILAETERNARPVDDAPDARFGAEFRELARQRRFVRDESPAAAPAAAAPPAAAANASTVAGRHAAASLAAQQAARVTDSMRISDDQRAVLAELARMSDRLVESREALAVASARADRAEADLADANQRMMAVRALVQDAQQATRLSAERCAWLEGRCETLQEALDLAVNASIVTRWRWRRQLRSAG